MKSERDLSINLYKYEDLKMRYGKLEEKMIELNKLVVKLNEEKKTLETNFIELKNKTTALQKELDNSEVVQQDFVKLSQTLQVKFVQLCFLLLPKTNFAPSLAHRTSQKLR